MNSLHAKCQGHTEKTRSRYYDLNTLESHKVHYVELRKLEKSQEVGTVGHIVDKMLAGVFEDD